MNRETVKTLLRLGKLVAMRGTDSGCWLWNGYMKGGTYPWARTEGYQEGVRKYLSDVTGEDPDILCCDPRCVNPRHKYRPRTRTLTRTNS